MDYRKFNTETWSLLDRTGDLVTGFSSKWLALNDNEESILHIFVDQNNHFHMAIEVTKRHGSFPHESGANGLKVEVTTYKLKSNPPKKFLDLSCTFGSYLPEFTKIVRQITQAILENKEEPVDAVFNIIKNWKAFWRNRTRSILSEDQQIGLICELLVLRRLCKINPKNSLTSWTGPLGEKHDFIFSDWGLEIKGTRKSKRIHTVNGIEQLLPPLKKKLALISFHVTIAENDDSYRLPDLISQLKEDFFAESPILEIQFFELLALTGYSPIHNDEYRTFGIGVQSSSLFTVHEEFPQLTTKMLIKPLTSRVSNIRYEINLEGMGGINFSDINWGDFFY